MTSHRAIINAYDFSKIDSLADIGGGNGALMFEILKANPSLNGTIADLPAAVKTAKNYITSIDYMNVVKLSNVIFSKISQLDAMHT